MFIAALSFVLFSYSRKRSLVQEKISRLFLLLKQVFYSTASSKLPFVCFPEQFEPVVSSFSAGEICWKPALSDKPWTINIEGHRPTSY